jgi:hypothetical protein
MHRTSMPGRRWTLRRPERRIAMQRWLRLALSMTGPRRYVASRTVTRGSWALVTVLAGAVQEAGTLTSRKAWGIHRDADQRRLIGEHPRMAVLSGGAQSTAEQLACWRPDSIASELATRQMSGDAESMPYL